MSEIMVLGLQDGRLDRERRERTLLEFLRERMDGLGRPERRKSLKERLGLTGIGCCGAHWGLGPITVLHDEQSPEREPVILTLAPAETSNLNSCDRDSPVGARTTGMNLAAALAAERQLRATQEPDDGLSPMGQEISRPPVEGTSSGTPSRMSLMRLLGEDFERESREKVGCDMVCCVCMGREKGAAFIPCGHTFCRVCSRELWVNRGSCPLCNRPILDILDIF